MGKGSVTAVFVASALAVSACSSSDDTSDATPPPADSVVDTTTPATTEAAPETTAVADPTTAPETTAAPETTIAPETTAAPSTTEPDEAGFEAIGPAVQAFVDDNGLNGAGLVVVDREDGVVHEEYWGEFGPDRVSYVASSTKMITAGVLLRLADDGLLDLDAPIADAVEWGSGNPEITPAQLVSNSSGLVGLGPEPTYAPYLCQFLPDNELEACGETAMTTPDDDDDIVPPDTEFRYGGVQWQIAGALAEAVSGKSWAELIDEIYVQPCGVESLGYNNHWFFANGFDYPSDLDPASLEPTENPHMEGGVFVDPLDYAALLLMHLRDGECDGGRVLSPESVARAHADRVAEYGDAGDPDLGYGMGWWVERDSTRIQDAGAYGSFPWLDTTNGYGAYLVIEDESGTGAQLYQQVVPLVEAAMGVG